MSGDGSGKLEVTPEIVKSIKQALEDLRCLYNGNGSVVIEMRHGRIMHVKLHDVILWNYTRGRDKDDGC